MADLKGTKTEKNLMEAFAGESQARNKYTYFASKAKKEGYEQIAAFFEETAGNEKEHAKIWFKLLCGGDIPATTDNLQAAADGEYEEWTDAYPKFAEIAKQEGFPEIAQTWTAISVAEKQHEARYRGFLKTLESGTIFKREGVSWNCRNCGFTVAAGNAPEQCPACLHPQAYFQILAENW